MKKIFAIALALVMVLSMASAFATLQCDPQWTWDDSACTYDCGTAQIFVDEYVRAKTACGYELVANGCAAALEGERVYYVVRLVVPENINEDWYNTAVKNSLKLTFTNLNSDLKLGAGTKLDTLYFGLPSWNTVKGGGTFYLKVAAEGTDKVYTKPYDDDWTDTFSEDVVRYAWVERSCAKVCAQISSKSTGDKINAYCWTVKYQDAKKITISEDDQGKKVTAADVLAYFGFDGKVLTFKKDNTLVVLALKNNKVDLAMAVKFDNSNHPIDIFVANGYRNGNLTGVDVDVAALGPEGGITLGAKGSLCHALADAILTVFKTFNIDFDTPITAKGIEKNFGWDDTVKDCTDYKANGTAIVDPECKIEIPKTGDVSVVAYAVMALVAAAGAMGLKK